MKIPRTRKVTPEQRQEIRGAYRAGEPVKDIAARYGVTSAAVSYHCAGVERPFPHGTNAGYQRHRARGDMCDPCRDARRASERAYREARSCA